MCWLWIAYPHPDLVAILDRFHPRAVIYDCVDEWSGFERAYDNLAVWEGEARAARRSGSYNGRPAPEEVVGAQFALFHGAQRCRSRVLCRREPVRTGRCRPYNRSPHWLCGKYRPACRSRAGDRGCPRARKDWQLIFIGDYLATEPQPAGDNIHWLGFRPYERMADYMASFDACIIPFYVDELTSAIDPLKLYQYLAAGKAGGVHTASQIVSDFAGVVRIAQRWR